MKIKIIHAPSQKEPYVILEKPSGLPTAPLNQQDENNALFQAICLYPELKEVTGKKPVEYGLIHRLDTVTRGLVLIAQTQSFYDYIINQQNLNLFTKTYSAICKYNLENAQKLTGFPPAQKIIFESGKQYEIKSMFRPFGQGNKEVRPVTNLSNQAAQKKVGKPVEYKTNITIKDVKGEYCSVECKIKAGFRHQVRNHLAWIGLPIVNDSLYNCESVGTENEIDFIASGLEFYYPEGDLNSYELLHLDLNQARLPIPPSGLKR